MLGLKMALISSAVALVVGGIGGWTVRDWKCDAAAGKAQTQHDQRQLDGHDAAAASETALVPAQHEALSNLEARIDAIRTKISAGECFAAGDVDRLRTLWPSGEK